MNTVASEKELYFSLYRKGHDYFRKALLAIYNSQPSGCPVVQPL